MADTPDGAHARGDEDASASRAQVQLDHTYDNAVLRVFQTAEWVPPAYREAYLQGAASVLGDRRVVDT